MTTSPAKERLESLDAFRGFTILGMVFVIAIAAGGYWKELQNPTPQMMSWFGSNPISTWYHAETGFDLWAYRHEQEGMKADEIRVLPDYADKLAIKNIGVTFTDLIAPWFVFIVGACLPLSRNRQGRDWWKHVGFRTIMLIVAGILYMSLVIKQVTWWWGVLQAIGIAYFCGALVLKLPPRMRWVAIFAVAIFQMAMTHFAHWWTAAFQDIYILDGQRVQIPGIAPEAAQGIPFGTLTNPNGDWCKPWIIHCQPWLSIGYGIMTMIGVQVGEAIASKDTGAIVKRCLLVGGVYTIIGYIIHKAGFVTGNLDLCFNKPDVTASYAFFSAGLGALAFLGFYWVIDVQRIRAWAQPLNVFGTNPLLAYFMMIMMRRFLFDNLGITPFFNLTANNPTIENVAKFFGGGEPAGWVYAFFDKGGYMGVFWGLVWTLCLWLIVLCFNRRKIYWKF